MPSVPAMCRGGSAWAFQSKTEKEKQAWSSCDASTNRSSGLFESRSRSNFDPQPDKDRNAAVRGFIEHDRTSGAYTLTDSGRAHDGS